LPLLGPGACQAAGKRRVHVGPSLLLSAGVALGSWIAIVPILLIVPFMVRRTLIEERMRADALPGYVGYMQRVRSRIVPGVW